ncbi:hypothetical protein V6N13_056871 [Hibiscus sabdariffa]
MVAREVEAKATQGFAESINKYSIWHEVVEFVELYTTHDFNVANVINDVGLDIVFQGIFVDDKLFTIKRLDTAALQNDIEFQNKLQTLGGIKSHFLITLLGYSVEQNKCLFRTDNLPDKSLQELFFEDGHLSRNWRTRFGIILGIVEAFECLQFSCIPFIHEEIEPDNVLFDYDYRTKISDFELLIIKVEGEFGVNLFCQSFRNQELWKSHQLYGIFEGTVSADTSAIWTHIGSNNTRKLSTPSHKPESIVVPVAVDSTQQEALMVLKELAIIEVAVKPDGLCTRREYARWLVRMSSLLERNHRHMIVPSIAFSGSEAAAFDDVGVDDPDFVFTQALAEACIIPSKL